MNVQAGPVSPSADDRPVSTILVVEDSRAQRHALAVSLRRRGYDVLEAGDGAEALRIAGDAPVDLILSDWMMPGMDGLDLCRHLRARPGPYMYFILLTSKDDKDAVARGLDVGADDFLSKPFHGEELRARIAAGERLLAAHRALIDRNAALNAALTRLQEFQTRIDEDLRQARRLQTALVPEWDRDVAHGHVSLLLRPCGHVGGDLVGFFPVGDTQIGFFALDVAGHGIASALMTARLASFLTTPAAEHNAALTRAEGGAVVMRPPHEVCADLNRLILGDSEDALYATLMLAHADLATGAVTLCQAGHPQPVILGRDGAIRRLDLTGLPIGLVDEARYESITIEMSPGDRLLLHSDGITEAADPFGVQAGETGLDELLMRLGHLPGRGLLDGIVADLARWAGDADFEDDISAILFRWDGPEPAP